jgi:hypothetical protein
MDVSGRKRNRHIDGMDDPRIHPPLDARVCSPAEQD